MDSTNKMPVIATLKETKRLLARYRIRIKRQLGQNFLVEPQIVAKIMAAAELTAADRVIEIGSGLGALSQALLSGGASSLTLLELDPSLTAILRELFGGRPGLEIIEADALGFDFWGHIQGNYKLLANLPYYLTTPLLNRLLTPQGGQSQGWQLLLLMLQKEAAQRVIAGPGGKDYGPLALAANYRAEIELIAHVPAACFYPRPNVDSSIIRLRRLEQPRVTLKDETLFFQLIKIAFGQRRKTLLNNLAGFKGKDKLFWQEFLSNLNLDGNKRAEELELEYFSILANAISTTLDISTHA